MSHHCCIVWSLFALLIQFRFNEIVAFECGTVDFVDPKITSGTATVKGAWPFIVALFYVDQSAFFCAGTLITAKNVLTAAHCVHQKYPVRKLAPQDVTVLLGAYNLDLKIESGAQQKDVNEIYVHPDWSAFSIKYDADLAILVLNETVVFTRYIHPICMPVDDPPIDVKGSVVGWGLTENSTMRPSSHLRLTTTKILNDSYCYTTKPKFAFVSSTRVFCSDGESGSPSRGDSGGGFFILSGKSWVQYGIVSAGEIDTKGNAIPNGFTIYTNVRSFRYWIDEMVRKSGYSEVSFRESEKIDLLCNYEVVGERLYQCSVKAVNVTNRNFEIDLFTGTHSLGFDTLDVTYIWFWTGTMQFIPYGIGNIFKNLEVFRVGYDDRNLGLKRLQRSNFKDMELLVHLDVRYNAIETMDEDTLHDLPNLKYFVINNNKLKVLHKNTFGRNHKLKQINANSNQLEILPIDLFENNAMLEEVNFKHNNLKKISTSFTHLLSVRKIDFHGNHCIDKVLDDVDNVTEFQTLLKYQCNGVEN
ncbi:uncharacterized protein LOC119068294 [Bradysia coprophila]|uniref:uncharacterized protein LOC119068294 n=1 Tax=Bradysia coprophila TaxID=38358 RepID=UPI00187DB1FC|nr:uncharacterized protein LOC119068294 [Bradysia coprophila]